MSVSRVIATLACGVVMVQGVQFGNYFSTGSSAGSMGDGNWIREATTTLLLPKTPHPVVQNLALWPGMETNTSELIQTLAVSYPPNIIGAGCGTKLKNKWCMTASTYHGVNNTQQDGAAVVEPPGTYVTIAYTYNEQESAYVQVVSVRGRTISTLTTSYNSVASGWGTAEECQAGTPCGVVPTHYWYDTSITLNEADPNYGDTVRTQGATGNLVTNDGGYTWTVGLITINEFDFTQGS